MPEITFANGDDIAIPDEFVLICNATGYGPINMMPIYHLGKSRIKKLVINCGVFDRRNPTSQETQSAVLPAERLVKFAIATLGLRDKIDIHVVDGDPDEFLCWDRGVQWAAIHGLPILCNFQGGTTQMSMGTAHALQASSANWMRILVSKYPASVRIPVMVGNQFEEIYLLDEDIEERVPLDLLLGSQGYELIRQETGHGGAISHQANRFYARFVTNISGQTRSRRDAMRAMNSLNRKTQSPVDLMPKEQALVAEWYSADDNPIPWNRGYFKTSAQRKFFYGGWLERAIFDQIQLLTADKPNFTISMNFEFRLEKSHSPANEVDILIRQRDVFHLLEVKSSTSPDYLMAAADKLIGINRIIGGRPSRAWLCAPFVNFGDDANGRHVRDEFTNRLEKKGITLLVGDEAVNTLHNEIAKLV